MKTKLRNVWVQRTLSVMVIAGLTTGAVACGGGDSDDNDSRGGAIEVPILDGLTGDANNQRRLFFTSSAEGSLGLYAFNPRTPERGAELVDSEIEPRAFHYNSIHGGTVKSSTQTVEDFHIGQILYSSRAKDDESGEALPFFMRGELRRVSTDPAPDTVVPVRVGASEQDGVVLSQTKRFIHFDLLHPMNTGFLYSDISQDSWVRVQLDDEPTVKPAFFGKDVEVISWVTDFDKAQETGWLVVHEKDGGRLERVDVTLKPVAPVRFKDSGEEVKGVTIGQPGHLLASGEQLLILGFEKNRESGELWAYETDGSAGDGGTIRALLNAEGEKLVFAFQAMIEGVGLPSDELSASHQGAFFFAQGPSMFNASWSRLYRIDSQGWSVFEHSRPGSTGSMDAIIYSMLGNFLIDAGENGLIWSLGGNIERVKATSADVSTWTREVLDDKTRGEQNSPVVGVRDGWIFYNSKQEGELKNVDVAVALNVRDQKRVVLKNAEWVGASSSGKGSYIGRQMGIELSEVFVLRNERELAAVSAADPMRGAVILGELPATTKRVVMYGVGSGPHRLIGIEHKNKGYEVAYVNTRETDSLNPLMSKVAVDWDETIEYTAFGDSDKQTMTLDVYGERTRPLDLF